MDAKDWLKLVEKKLEIASVSTMKRFFSQHTSYLEPQQTGGRLTTTPTPMSRLSPGMSSRLILELTMCPTAPSR
jgi:hypothetical protein